MKYAVSPGGDVLSADGKVPANPDQLGIYAAMRALRVALEKSGVAPATGPARDVLLAMSAANFDTLRQALGGADDFSRQLVRGCSNSPKGKGRMMIAGIEIYDAGS